MHTEKNPDICYIRHETLPHSVKVKVKGKVVSGLN